MTLEQKIIAALILIVLFLGENVGVFLYGRATANAAAANAVVSSQQQQAQGAATAADNAAKREVVYRDRWHIIEASSATCLDQKVPDDIAKLLEKAP